MLVLIGVFVLGVAYLVVLNRASEKIVSTLLSGLVALSAVLLAVVVFGDESRQTSRFPVAFFMFQSNKTPIHIPFREDLQDYFLIADLQANDPQLMHDGDNGQTLYHEFLQKAIIDSLAFRYSGGWDAEAVRYRTSGMTMRTTYPGKTSKMRRLTVGDLEQSMDGNRFAKKHMMPLPLSLPPDSNLKVTAPKLTTQGMQQGTIEISNPFATVTIRTRPMQYRAGLGGYSLMTDLAMGEDQKQFCGFTYELQVSVTFNRFRSGHPDMPAYKKWADEIIAELDTDFNEEKISEATLHRYLLVKQAAQFGAHVVPDSIMGFNAPTRQ